MAETRVIFAAADIDVSVTLCRGKPSAGTIDINPPRSFDHVRAFDTSPA